MNSAEGVNNNVRRKNRRKRRKKASKDTGSKMKPIVVAEVENHTGVKTNVGKNRCNRRKKASNDSIISNAINDNISNNTVGVKVAHVVKALEKTEVTGKKMKSEFEYLKEEKVGMNSNDDDSDDCEESDDSWDHDHSKCLEEQELKRAREQEEREHRWLLADRKLREMEMDQRRGVMSKMYKVDVEMVKRLEEADRCLKIGIR